MHFRMIEDEELNELTDNVAKKLDEVKIERTIMKESQKRVVKEGGDKLEAMQWFDYLKCLKIQ